MLKVTYGSRKEISGDLNEEMITKIKNDLTVPNPAYVAAQKYSKWGKTYIPKYLTFYTETHPSDDPTTCVMSVPIGYSLNSNLIDYVDNRVSTQVDYPCFNLQLREDQITAVAHYIAHNKFYRVNGLIQMPTGKGKSMVGIYLASTLRAKTLVIVHKDDLVLGWGKDIALAFDGKLKCGLIKAQSRTIGEQITLATIQTLNRLPTEALEELYSEFSMVIVDECHHCPASSYTLLDGFKARFKMGLSATPERADGLTPIMSFHLGGFCYQYEYRADDQDILPVEVVAQNSSVYFNPICHVYRNEDGDIKETQVVDFFASEKKVLKENEVRIKNLPHDLRPKLIYSEVDNFIVTRPDYVKQVCDDVLREYRNGKNILIFLTQKEHCRLYYEQLTKVLGMFAVQLYYGDSEDRTDLVLSRAESGECRITISTYSKGTEGTNVKAWDTCFLVSSVNSGKTAEQAIGRIRRSKENKPSPVTVYDYKHPDCYLMYSHWDTRNKRYHELKFTFRSSHKTFVPHKKFTPFKKNYLTNE